MKREILFRGLTLKDNEMVYGDIRKFGNCYVIKTPFEQIGIIRQETLSQYTGKKDKNGNKIFEGDVVRYSFIDEESGESKSEEFLVQWEEEYAGFYLSSNKFQGEDTLFGTENLFEVVGNIFENPEFAEVFKKTRKTI